MLKERIMLPLLLIAAAGAAVFYYIVNPADSQLMPHCILKVITGVDCPACGSQRAMHALLHGHLAAALRYNLFMLYSVPYLIAVLWGYSRLLPGGAFMRRTAHSRTAMLTYIALFTAWWIIRNIIGI